MKEKAKNILTIILKNAINALLTSSAMMAFNWGAFNYKTADGWWNLGKLVLAVVASREAAVWLPIILKWSSTSSNPAAELKGGGIIVPPHP